MEIEQILTKETVKFLKKKLSEMTIKKKWFWIKSVDDLVQDTLVMFIQSYNKGNFQYQGQDKLNGYLLHTASFIVKTRQKQSIANKELNLFFDGSDDADTSIIDVISTEEDPLAETKKELHEAIAQLKPRRRMIMERIVGGEKVREICRSTDLTPAAVSGLKFNAIQDLKRIMKVDKNSS